MAGKNLSKDEKLKEIVHCKLDPLYFFNNYIYLEEPGSSQSFKTYDSQNKFVKFFLNEHYVITLKSRQIGFSTITQAITAWCMVFFDNIIVGLLSRSGPEATDFTRKTRLMVENLPKWLCPKLGDEDNKQNFSLSNGSRLFASQVYQANPKSVFRGKTLTLLIIDEAAFIMNIQQAYSGIAPATLRAHQVAENKKIPYGIIVLSTPNGTVGIGQWYYDTWNKALTNDTIFKPIRVHYSEAPFADASWYEKQKLILNNDELSIQQELELKFVTDSSALFESDTAIKLQEIKKQTVYEKIERMYFDSLNKIGTGNWYFYNKPQQEKFYLIGVDIASSYGACNSAIEVIEYPSLNQVAEYVGKLRITDLEEEIIYICEKFENCILIPEANSYGSQLVERLSNLDQTKDKLYFRSKYNKEGQLTEVLPGFQTDSKTKPLLIEILYWNIKENTDRIKSQILINELLGLDKNLKGGLSDLVMALSFCYYVAKYEKDYLKTYYQPLTGTEKKIMDDFFGFPDEEKQEIKKGITIKVKDEDDIPILDKIFGVDEDKKVQTFKIYNNIRIK